MHLQVSVLSESEFGRTAGMLRGARSLGRKVRRSAKLPCRRKNGDEEAVELTEFGRSKKILTRLTINTLTPIDRLNSAYVHITLLLESSSFPLQVRPRLHLAAGELTPSSNENTISASLVDGRSMHPLYSKHASSHEQNEQSVSILVCSYLSGPTFLHITLRLHYS